MNKHNKEIEKKATEKAVFVTLVFKELIKILFPANDETKITKKGFVKIMHDIMQPVNMKHELVMNLITLGAEPLTAISIISTLANLSDITKISEMEFHDCEKCDKAEECPIKDQVLELKSRKIMEDLLKNVSIN